MKPSFTITIKEIGVNAYEADVKHDNTQTLLLATTGLSLDETLARINYTVRQSQGVVK